MDLGPAIIEPRFARGFEDGWHAPPIDRHPAYKGGLIAVLARAVGGMDGVSDRWVVRIFHPRGEALLNGCVCSARHVFVLLSDFRRAIRRGLRWCGCPAWQEPAW